MLRQGLNFHDAQEGRQTDTLHGLTHALAVLTNFHPPIPNFLDHVDESFEIVFCAHLDKRNDHGSELGTIKNRGLGSDQNGKRNNFV